MNILLPFSRTPRKVVTVGPNDLHTLVLNVLVLSPLTLGTNLVTLLLHMKIVVVGRFGFQQSIHYLDSFLSLGP